jgi:hypothetical protein
MHTEELIIGTYERMNNAFEENMDNTIASIQEKSVLLDGMFKGPQYN